MISEHELREALRSLEALQECGGLDQIARQHSNLAEQLRVLDQLPLPRLSHELAELTKQIKDRAPLGPDATQAAALREAIGQFERSKRQIALPPIDESQRRALSEINTSAVAEIARQFEAIRPYLPADLLKREATALGRQLSEIVSPPVMEALRRLNEQADRANLVAFQQAVRELTELRELLPWELDDGLEFLDLELGPEASRELFDQRAEELLGISGKEFLRRWDAGEYAVVFDDPDYPEVTEVALMLPLAR